MVDVFGANLVVLLDCLELATLRDEKCLSEFEVLNMYDSINPANIDENSDSAFARDSCSGENQSCKSHTDCSEYANAPFCYAGECASCDECHYCKDGIDSTCGFCGEGYPTRESKTCTLEATEQEQFPGDDMFISSTEEPFEFADGIVIDDDENKRCPIFPVYAYWSNFYNNSLYIPHNKSPPRKFKSYHLFTHVFSLSQCKEDSIALFQCRVSKNYNYFSSFLSISPEIECTENTGYPRKEKT